MPSEFNCPTNCGTLSIDEDRLANVGGVAANRAITKYSCPELHQIGDILGLAMRGSVRVVQMCFYLKMSFSHDGLSFPFTFCSRRNRYGGIAKKSNERVREQIQVSIYRRGVLTTDQAMRRKAE